MRILILSDRIPPENIGGAEKVTWALARGLHEAGHEVHIIAATPGAAFEASRDGIPTYHLHVRYPPRLRAYFALANPQVSGPLGRLYARIQPDVVSAFNIHADLTYYALLLAKRMGFAVTLNTQDVMAFAYNKLTHFVDPAVCGVRYPSEYRLPPLYNLKLNRLRYNPLRNPFIRYVLNHAVDVGVAGSEALRQAQEANGIHGFRVVRASIVPQDFDAAPETVMSLRQRLGLENRRVILFAGRLTRDKGSHEALRMLGAVIQQVPNALLLTLTRASLESQGLNAYPHLAAHVAAGGWLHGEELAAAYHLADVVTVPSVCFDTFPTINLEAMAAAKPLLSTCYGGSAEAVKDGVTGYIINPFDTGDYAEKTARLLVDDALRLRMGEAGRAHLLSGFTLPRMVAEMEAVYEDALRLGRSQRH